MDLAKLPLPFVFQAFWFFLLLGKLDYTVALRIPAGLTSMFPARSSWSELHLVGFHVAASWCYPTILILGQKSNLRWKIGLWDLRRSKAPSTRSCGLSSLRIAGKPMFVLLSHQLNTVIAAPRHWYWPWKVEWQLVWYAWASQGQLSPLLAGALQVSQPVVPQGRGKGGRRPYLCRHICPVSTLSHWGKSVLGEPIMTILLQVGFSHGSLGGSSCCSLHSSLHGYPYVSCPGFPGGSTWVSSRVSP